MDQEIESLQLVCIEYYEGRGNHHTPILLPAGVYMKPLTRTYVESFRMATSKINWVTVMLCFYDAAVKSQVNFKH